MSDVGAELSTLDSQLAALTERIATAATEAHQRHDEALSADLFEVERALTAAARRLRAATRRYR